MMPTSHHYQMSQVTDFGTNAGTMGFHPELGEMQFEPHVLDQNIQMQNQRHQAYSATPTMQQNNNMPAWPQPGIPNAQMPVMNQQPQQGSMNPMMQQWANQMPQAQMQNPMMQMPFNMLFQEAFAMSQPVDSSDEPKLLTTLLTATRADRNFKEALNSLHGTNGHSATLWKDYYLEHKTRIDEWIAMCIKKEKESSREISAGPSKPRTAIHTNGSTQSSSSARPASGLITTKIKKPSPSTFKREDSPPPRKRVHSRPSTGTPPVKPVKTKSNRSTPVTDVPIMSGRRSTMNSLSVDEPVFDFRLPPPNASIKVPEPPSRSPTPPTQVVESVRGRGNRFTDEDRAYFIKFLGWSLKNDPSLSRKDLCYLLAQKAPHHSQMSWLSFWSNNHDLPDKIMAAAEGKLPEEPRAVSYQRQRLNYRDPDTSDDEPTYRPTKTRRYEEDDDDEIQTYSASEMSLSGTFNDADFYMAAKFMASPEWDDLGTSTARWQAFADKYSGRNYKCWVEYARKRDEGLQRMVRRMKRKGQATASTQRAQPSHLPSFTKRKHEDEDSAGSIKRGKRAKSDSTSVGSASEWDS